MYDSRTRLEASRFLDKVIDLGVIMIFDNVDRIEVFSCQRRIVLHELKTGSIEIEGTILSNMMDNHVAGVIVMIRR